MLLNRQWGRDAWASRKPRSRWGSSWTRSWTRRRPRRARLLRRHYLLQKTQENPIDSSQTGKSEGFDEQHELFLPEQSRKILRLANFERDQPNSEERVFHQKLYHVDRSDDKGQFGQNNRDNSIQYKHKSDPSLPTRSEKSIVKQYLQAGTNKRPNLPFTSKAQLKLKIRGVQRGPNTSKTSLKPRVFRVRRKKALTTMMPAKKRKVSTAFDKLYPQSFFSKNQQQKGKTKLRGQDRALLDVVFPRSLFSQNQYAKTKLNSQPE